MKVIKIIDEIDFDLKTRDVDAIAFGCVRHIEKQKEKLAILFARYGDKMNCHVYEEVKSVLGE